MFLSCCAVNRQVIAVVSTRWSGTAPLAPPSFSTKQWSAMIQPTIRGEFNGGETGKSMSVRELAAHREDGWCNIPYHSSGA